MHLKSFPVAAEGAVTLLHVVALYLGSQINILSTPPRCSISDWPNAAGAQAGCVDKAEIWLAV